MVIEIVVPKAVIKLYAVPNLRNPEYVCEHIHRDPELPDDKIGTCAGFSDGSEELVSTLCTACSKEYVEGAAYEIQNNK
jgi:hypothetical protein